MKAQTRQRMDHEARVLCIADGTTLDYHGLAEKLPHSRITCVLDREADFFELFDAHREHAGVDLLIRASHNRRLSKTEKLFDRLRGSKVRGRMQLTVKQQSARLIK